jgi:hypothetical protein
MGEQDEEAGNDRYESVCSFVHVVSTSFDPNLAGASSMAVGLGMDEDEQEDLLKKVDDSFWVMRVIGSLESYP